MARKLFCELHPICYEISRTKEILRRHLQDRLNGGPFAVQHCSEEFPNIVKSHTSILVRKLLGVDLSLQENKVTNIELACKRISGIVIAPGETFSFWRTVGRPSYRKGYKDGLVISRHGFISGVGGGLCQMANMIHWLV
ncbi:MAG: VanW family protein, partial [Clostridia bacterium]|nr:VanW family protein [Clostridia bacterium]